MAGPWGGARTECDGVVGAAAAGECGGGVVECIAVGARTRGLEHLRVGRRPARRRGREGAAAAVLGPRERVARAPARGASAGPELRGAHRVQVRGAPGRRARRGPAEAPAAGGLHQHGEVVAVHEADVVEVQPAAAVERELGQRRRRRGARARALGGAGAAVARGADKPPRGAVLRAARARPHAAGPARRRRHRARGARRELEPRGLQPRAAGVGQDARPHRVRAPVHERERGRLPLCRKQKCFSFVYPPLLTKSRDLEEERNINRFVQKRKWITSPQDQEHEHEDGHGSWQRHCCASRLCSDGVVDAAATATTSKKRAQCHCVSAVTTACTGGVVTSPFQLTKGRGGESWGSQQPPPASDGGMRWRSGEQSGGGEGIFGEALRLYL
jgi:hypothetical protein